MRRFLAITLIAGLAACTSSTDSFDTSLSASQKSFRQASTESLNPFRQDNAKTGALFGFIACAIGGCDLGETIQATQVGTLAGGINTGFPEANALDPTPSKLSEMTKIAQNHTRALTRVAKNARRTYRTHQQQIAAFNSAIAVSPAELPKYRDRYVLMQDDMQILSNMVEIGQARLRRINLLGQKFTAVGIDPATLLQERNKQAVLLEGMTSVLQGMEQQLAGVPRSIRDLATTRGSSSVPSAIVKAAKFSGSN